jgi:hypothetical protein
MRGVRVERLDHLGIVAGICREIGLAEYLDGLAGPTQQQVSVGTATVAQQLKKLPPWLSVRSQFLPHAKQRHPGRPRRRSPSASWPSAS